MKIARALLLVLAVGSAIAAQENRTQVAEQVLRKGNPAVDWNVGSAKIADFDCDGTPDTVMLGSEKDRVVVGIVWGTPKKREEILTFPVGTPTQDGFSTHPTKIEIHPLDCKTADGWALPGCKSVPGCMTFSVPDAYADAFNFYWDSSDRKLAWWRL